MAATGFSPICLYASGTAGHIPLAANLTNTTNGSEIALNYADGNLFFKNASNSVITTPLLQASGSQNGWLSSTDWTTFNGKQAALVSGTNIKSLGGASLLGSGNLNNISDLGIGVAPYAANNALWINNDSGDSNNKFNIDGYADGLYINATSYSGAATGTSIILGTSTAALGYSVPRVIIFPAGGVSIGNTTDPGAGNLSVQGKGLFGTSTAPTEGASFRLKNSNQATIQWSAGAADGGAFIVYNQNSTGVYLSSGATSWTANSDERLKTELTPFTNAAEKVTSLRAGTGRYLTDDESVSRSFLIAQDVQKVLPEAVNVQADEKGTLGLQYTDVIPLLVAAISELNKRIKVLENK